MAPSEQVMAEALAHRRAHLQQLGSLLRRRIEVNQYTVGTLGRSDTTQGSASSHASKLLQVPALGHVAARAGAGAGAADAVGWCRWHEVTVYGREHTDHGCMGTKVAHGLMQLTCWADSNPEPLPSPGAPGWSLQPMTSCERRQLRPARSCRPACERSRACSCSAWLSCSSACCPLAR